MCMHCNYDDMNIKLTSHGRGRGGEPGLRSFKHFGLESQNKNLIIKMYIYIYNMWVYIV